jgi:hypothetical protein
MISDYARRFNSARKWQIENQHSHRLIIAYFPEKHQSVLSNFIMYKYDSRIAGTDEALKES